MCWRSFGAAKYQALRLLSALRTERAVVCRKRYPYAARIGHTNASLFIADMMAYGN